MYTEIHSCLALQSQLYSSYKSRTTLKDLIGISPNGSIYFVSELWSGSISDRELVIKSEHLSIRQISSSPSSSDSHVIMGGIQVPKVTEHKHLGITIQTSLKWSRHICNVYTACARRVGILRRLKRKLQPSTILKIYTGTVRPIMEYACAIWSGGPTAKLKKLQRSFCRSHGVSLPPLQTRFDYFTLMLFYKIRMRLSPQSLQNMLPNPSSHSGYQFRKLSYPVPKVKKSSTLASFFPRAIILWNDLPANLHSINTLSKFKSELRKHLKLQ